MGIQISHMRFKIKYHPFIFEKIQNLAKENKKLQSVIVTLTSV